MPKSSRRSQASKKAARRRWAKGRGQSGELRDAKGANSSRTASRVECPHCGHLYESHVQQLRHLAACHRDRLDATEVGRLGKVILYQSTARLFHCASCFYTFKDFSKLFVHLITKHCMEEEEVVEEEAGGKDRTRRRTDEEEEKIRKDGAGIKEEEEGHKEQAKTEMEMKEEGEKTLGPAGAGEVANEGREDSAHPVKGEGGPEAEEEGPTPQSSGQPHLKAKDAVSKYVAYESCRYSCRLCGHSAKTKGRVLSHVHRSHEVNGPYKCRECAATFLLPVYLQQHAGSAHRSRSYVCPFCESRSRSPLILRLHCTRCRGSRGQAGAPEGGRLEGMDLGGAGGEQQEQEVA